ncbi:MAG: Gar1/Naf1 family protein [Archaeoglobaceae archaeon]|nr:Gar1/Naf1 family protein [Archaeoglobaceae archaeon]MCX8152481.1 Gar1/Naf1 family protein [Archaeoglobaceae archaeon]MDW8013704.1 Gar1/Naf1 family protein [Archaeoglobaceae archaeon]
MIEKLIYRRVVKYLNPLVQVKSLMKLIELGKVQHISKSGMIVVQLKPSSVPKIGDKVVTKKMEPVGVIQDIIGPVSSPYALIKPEKKAGNYDLLFVVKDYGRVGKGESEGGRKRERGRKERDRKGRRL